MFAIVQILLGWKTCKYYYETDELPNPKANPTQEKVLRSRLNVAFGATFSPQPIICCGLGLILYRRQDYKKPHPTKSSSNTLLIDTMVGFVGCWLVGWLACLFGWVWCLRFTKLCRVGLGWETRILPISYVWKPNERHHNPKATTQPKKLITKMVTRSQHFMKNQRTP